MSLNFLLAGFIHAAEAYPEINDKHASYRANEILVKYRNRAEIATVFLSGNESVSGAVSRLNRNPEVEYAEPNYIYEATIIPSDTYYVNQWYLPRIKAPEAWNIVRESPQVVIAVIDSGVQINHPDLKDNIWRNPGEIAENGRDDDQNGYIDDLHGWDFVNDVADPSPKYSEGYTEEGILHGTIVAGLAAASGNNAAGIAGLTWNAQIMALKALDDKGEGDTAKVVKAVDYAIVQGVDIINFSFVGHGFSRALESAIARAHAAGIHIVAAAGNELANGQSVDLDNTPLYPACHDGPSGENMVIGVAATDALDQKAPFSGYGHNCVDIAAPGVSMFSTAVYSPEKSINGRPFNKYYDGYWSGTSMAAPLVSAAIALIETVNLGLSRQEVREILLSGADNISRLNPDYAGRLGTGRLNVFRSVSSAKAKLDALNMKLIIGPAGPGEEKMKITEPAGRLLNELSLVDTLSEASVVFAAGDINGNGRDEIIVGAGNGEPPYVRVFDPAGTLLSEFFAYHENFRGGVNVAVGDLDGDGISEIITGARFGGGPHVRVFDLAGRLLAQFFAYHENFRGGVNVAVGDLDGDGISEIITGAGFGGGPQVRIFDGRGRVRGQFFAYHENFRGGVNVATGRVIAGTRKDRSEIITAPGRGGGPHVIIFSDRGEKLAQFFAYNQNFTGGVNIAAGDLNADGLDEIITGAGPGGAPHVRVFDNNGSVVHSFYAYPESYAGGVYVGCLNMAR